MRSLLTALLTLSLLAAACGDDDVETTDAGSTTIVDDSTPDDDHDEDEEGEGRDPDAIFGADVCRALLPALDGETAGLDRYATEDVLDQLDGFGPSESAEVAEVDEGCEIAIGDVWATLTLMGDGHVGQSAVDITFGASDDAGGDGFDPFVEDVPAAVDDYLAGPDACDGFAEPPAAGPNHEIYGLGGGYVVGIVCFQAAYQNSYVFFGWDGQALVDLTVQQWQESGDVIESSFVAGLPSVEDGELTNVEKARGVGDCGVRSLWNLVDTTLVLEIAWARSCDDESEPVGPEDWPIVYASVD